MRGHLVKWLGGALLLKRVDRVRLSGGTPLLRPMRCHGAHWHQGHPHCEANVGLLGTESAVAERRASEHGSMPFLPHGLSTRVPKDACYRPLAFPSRPVVPIALAARLGFGFDGTRLRTVAPFKTNVPPNHFTKWPRAAKAKRDYPPEVGGSNILRARKGTRRMAELKRGRSSR